MSGDELIENWLKESDNILAKMTDNITIEENKASESMIIDNMKAKIAMENTNEAIENQQIEAMKSINQTDKRLKKNYYKHGRWTSIPISQELRAQLNEMKKKDLKVGIIDNWDDWLRHKLEIGK